MNKKYLMKMAWNIAKKAAIKFNDKPSVFFAQSLKEAWTLIKKCLNPVHLITEPKVEVSVKPRVLTGRDIFDPNKTYRDPWAAKAARRKFEARQNAKRKSSRLWCGNVRHMDPLWKTHSVN
ncbi:hypothetical protein V4F87_003296 [Vibrio parahaemolyticus]|nr:hypothetical protein [Vibrio parahaemolyticus]